MKVKALRYKKEHNPFQEFVRLDVNYGLGLCGIYTSDTPIIQPESATLEGMQDYYESNNIEIDWDKLELVEFELVEKNTIGADIRNKLTPSYNLISLLELYFKDNVAHAIEKRAKLATLIKKEMKKSKECIKYIANLL
jgi:hypothetical protein